MNEQYSPTGFKVLPTIVKHLLIINVLMYFAYYVLYLELVDRLVPYLAAADLYVHARQFRPSVFQHVFVVDVWLGA